MYHILLIDDNAFFTATFAGLLRRTGYRVSVATSLEQSQQLQQQDPADLILLGIYLKKHSAHVYLQALSSTFARAPVIGLFCDGDRNHPRYPLLVHELGPQRVHHKPFRTEELLSCLDAELRVTTRRAG